jgi:sec-independent protein translocase protein TatC
MTSAATVPAYQHVRELRARIFWCVLALFIGAAIGYVFRAALIAFLERPLGESLFYTSPTGSFEFVMRVCFLVGFLFALPVIIYHLLRFIEPALPRAITLRLIITVITASFSLMVAGVAFGYFVSLPAALHFFNQVGTSNLKALITADRYFSFVVNYLAVFAAVFQLPLLLLLINRFTPLGPGTLGRYRRYVFVASFVVALITPSAPDPLSQVILAIPIIVLYEASIWLIWIANRRRPATHTPVPAAPLARRSRPAPRPIARARPAMPPQQLARPVRPQPIPAPATIDLRGTTLSRPPRPAHVLDLRPQAAP